MMKIISMEPCLGEMYFLYFENKRNLQENCAIQMIKAYHVSHIPKIK